MKRAVAIAQREGFANSCRPEQGRLLLALAAGARLVSVELDAERAGLAAELFAGLPQVTVLNGGWPEIHREAPFDLLVLDGGAYGKSGGVLADPEALLRPGR